MEIKKLDWRDNTTDVGKEKGLIDMISGVKELDITYYIRNYKHWGEESSGKYYLVTIRNGHYITEHDSIETCKEKAQEYFKQIVLDLFFDHEGQKIEYPKSGTPFFSVER